jgi:hypothetical protein
MKTLNMFDKFPLVSILMILLVSCTSEKLRFKSDDQMKLNFQQNKISLLNLSEKCKNGSESQKEDIIESFMICKIDRANLEHIGIEQIAINVNAGIYPSKPVIRKNAILFVMNNQNDLPRDFFVEETGYLFSTVPPIEKDIVKDGSLDKFFGTKLIPKLSMTEGWRFKNIEPNWYLYYRQYYRSFLH